MINPEISIKSVGIINSTLSSKYADGVWIYLHAVVELCNNITTYYITSKEGREYLATQDLQQAVDEYNALG